MRLISKTKQYVYAIYEERAFIFNMNNVKQKINPIGYFLTPDGDKYDVHIDSAFGEKFINKVLDEGLTRVENETSDRYTDRSGYDTR